MNQLDRPLFEVLWEVRPFLFSILQNRNWPIAERAAAVLLFACEMQELIDQRQYDTILRRLESGQKPEKRKSLEQTFEKYRNRTMEKEVWMKQILNMYEGLETIKEEWNVLLSDGMCIMHSGEDLHAVLIAAGLASAEQAEEEQSSFLRNYAVSYQEFWDYYQRQEYEFEHILVYYLFQYFLGASYDGDAFTKVKFAVVSYLVILELDISVWLKQQKEFLYEDQVLVAHAYSKEVEHSYNNFESLQLVLSAHPILDVEHILIALLS
ncbi:MAG: flagellin lysine-N-methylase [Lachnospiraceae bacterium]|nr:flagellin lysine-N-methylase [Lachnospiraceae bacterium]